MLSQYWTERQLAALVRIFGDFNVKQWSAASENDNDQNCPQ
jgi:hypothetical protein